MPKRQARRNHSKGRGTRQSPAKKVYPSFAGLKPSSEASSRSKKANKSKGTKHELLLRKALRQLGLRFKVNVDSLPGKPDIVFPTEKVVVFCDGDFWHGRNWRPLRHNLSTGSNSQYWVSKIKANIKHGKQTSERLRLMGYEVIRVWESETRTKRDIIAERIKNSIRRKPSRWHK